MSDKVPNRLTKTKRFEMDEASYSEACLQCSFHSDLTQHAHRNMKIYMNMEDQLQLHRPTVKICYSLLYPSPKIKKCKMTQVAITHCPDTCSLPHLEKKKSWKV